MKRVLLRGISLTTRNFVNSYAKASQNPLHSFTPLAASTQSPLRFFSSESDPPAENKPNPVLESSSIAQANAKDLEDLKVRIENYVEGDKEALTSILEALFQMKFSGKHEETDDEETDDELMDATELPPDDVTDGEFESDDMVKETVEHGYMKDTKECEEIPKGMLGWQSLPDKLRKELEEKFKALGEMCAQGELRWETCLVATDMLVPNMTKKSDVPPTILRWKAEAVSASDDDPWLPKNRKVTMSVTVNKLWLSKCQSRRLRRLAGKGYHPGIDELTITYHPGKDELTITCESFERREENQKYCLRTLFSLIEQACPSNVQYPPPPPFMDESDESLDWFAYLI